MKDTYAWLTHHTFLHIALNRWLYAALILVVGFIAVMWICRGIAHRLRTLNKRKSRPLLAVFAEALESTSSWLMLLLFAALGARALGLPANVMRWLGIVVAAAIAFQVGLWLNGAIRAWIGNQLNSEDVQARNPVILALLGWMMRLAVWAMLLLTVLGFAQVNVTAFVASLGVGGIAIALGLQTVLSDLFASIAIGLDKPFEVGQFINFGDTWGTVKYVGIRTTRLASLGGEQVIIGNAQLLKNTIHNYGRMDSRRIVFDFGVTRDTDRKLLSKIPEMAHEIIDGLEDMRFDRAQLIGVGDGPLDYHFQVIYTMTNPDFTLYRTRQQVVLLTLMEQFEDLGIKIAFPTQTLRVGVDSAVKTELVDQRETPQEDDGKTANASG